jgi:hypothetical protein
MRKKAATVMCAVTQSSPLTSRHHYARSSEQEHQPVAHATILLTHKQSIKKAFQQLNNHRTETMMQKAPKV